MMAKLALALLACAWLSTAVLAQGPCVCLEQFGTEDLRNPVFFITAPGDDERIYVGEQPGYLWVYYRDGTRNPEVFMDISERFEDSLGSFDERGLLGMAFHPDYQNNNKFYIYATDLRGMEITRLSEFQIMDGNPDLADMSTERSLLEIDQPARNHNGGEIFFGMFDGYMYVFPGDGGPSWPAQDMGELLGKVLRIDVDTGDDEIPYNIPEDNPFLGMEGTREEIYALGLRNAWRCTQDRGDPDTGDGRGTIYCGDVGQNYCEEIDIIVRGGNYGWNVKECIFCYPPNLPDPDDCSDEPVVTPGDEQLPIYWYTDWAGSQSITGGHVYRGSEMPAFQGHYFWADWRIRDHSGLNRLRQVGDEWDNEVVGLCPEGACGEWRDEHMAYAFAFGQDQDNELYIMESDTVNPTDFGGSLFKVVQPGESKKGSA